MDEIKIKTINFEMDLDYIYSTYEDLYSLNFPDFKLTKKGFKNFKQEVLGVKGKKNLKIFVLRENNTPVGYIQIKIENISTKNKNNLIVSKLYINENKRNSGYGKKLMNFVREFAKKRNCSIIYLNSFENNFEIYKKMGFEPISYWMQMKID